MQKGRAAQEKLCVEHPEHSSSEEELTPSSLAMLGSGGCSDKATPIDVPCRAPSTVDTATAGIAECSAQPFEPESATSPARIEALSVVLTAQTDPA